MKSRISILCVWQVARRPVLVVMAVLLLSLQQAAAFTTEDFDCAIQGGFAGTCFYSQACANNGSSPADTSSTNTPSGSSSSSTVSATNISINGPFLPKAYPSNKINTGDSYKGTASSYGNDPTTGYIDPGDVDQNGNPLKPALQGATNAQPAIAVYNDGSLGGWWAVIAPNGKSAILQQTDVGPSTSRIVDINSVAARTVFGYQEGNGFPTDQGQWKIQYLGKNQPNGATTQASGSSSTNQSAGSSTAQDTGNNASSSCTCTSTTSFGPGNLPSYVKQPYNSIFTAAGSKYNVDPGVLVGIFYDENYGYQNAVASFNQHLWPDPPPPYGHGPNWPVSSAAAEGPFQFIPGTWATYGVDGNGDGKKDPTDLTDESFGAANYLAHLGATNPETQSKIENAATSYSGGYPTYSQAAFAIFKAIKADEVAGGTNTGGGAVVAGSTDTTGCSSSQSTSGPDCSSGGQTAIGDAKILCEAEQYKGIYYLFGGGHQGYSSFRQQCPISSLPSAAASSTPGSPGPCATDCSGLVYVALDQAFGLNYMGIVDSSTGVMSAATQYWKKIPISHAQAGDIVTMPDHVEIVDHVSGSTVYTFGSHHTGTQTGPITTNASYWTTGAWHWTGPGSS